ncbi:MAG: domain S-box protein [Solirubrobacteraceae bacterium]|nr:domain S-box protein [Solirubrobacteraceae bacterium]
MDGLSTLPSDAAHDQRLLALSEDLLGWLGPDGLLRPANPAWSASLGWTDEQLRAMAFLDLVAVDDRAAAGAALHAVAGIGAAEFDARARCADGGQRPLRWSAQAGGSDDGVLLAGRDLTELRRLEHDLQEFAYTASHDLAEPLRMVSSYLELLQRRYAGQLDETADEFIGFAVGGAVRMKALIDDLLAYSRVGSREMELGVVDLAVLLDNVVEGLERSIGQAGATVEASGSLARVTGDATLIAQLLQQLVANGVKFRDGGRPALVTVSASEEDGGVRIDVADNGIGIDPAQHERIFKMFSRLHGRDDYEGTGIGLAVGRRITERHGGRLWLDSEPGAGSTFHVWLPGAP